MFNRVSTINRVFIAIAFLAASPAMVFSHAQAQDIFVSFGQGANVTSTATATAGGSGSAFIYVRNGFEFRAFDLEVTSSDSSIVALTGATLFNDPFDSPFQTVTRWDQPLFAGAAGASGQLVALALSNNSNGITSGSASFDSDFDFAANAFLLARIDYELVGDGDVEICVGETPSGPGVFSPLFAPVSPSFACGELTVECLLGDVNLDGVVDFFDIFPFITVVGNNGFQCEADANQDGVVDFSDIPAFICLFLPSIVSGC